MSRTHPRYKIDTNFDLNDNLNTQSKTNLTSSKLKTIFKPNILWIAFGILIFIGLTLLIVLPIIILANKGDVTTSTKSTICPTTSITTTVTASSLPSQCSSYTLINDDDTRSPDYTATASCDDAVFTSTPEWVRFTGTGGTLLANCPIEMLRCGTYAAGWYTGIYPSMAGDTTGGIVCFSFLSNYCYWTILILVTNCNGFYVYYLQEPPDCDMRYCTI